MSQPLGDDDTPASPYRVRLRRHPAATKPPAIEPEGDADIELVVDPYFPKTIQSVLPALRGLAVHAGGRNRIFLDLHAKWIRDIRTN